MGRDMSFAPFADELKCSLSGVSDWDYWHDIDSMVSVELAAYDRWNSNRLSIGPNSRGITEALGGSLGYASAPSEELARERILGIEELSLLAPADGDDPQLAVFFEALARLVDRFDGKVEIEASIGGPLTIASFLRGPENLVRDCRRRPDFVESLLDVVVETQRRCIAKIASCGGFVAMADPMANPALIGPALYETMVLPRTMELAKLAEKSCGRGPSLHMCGRTESIWPCLKRLPLYELSLDNAIDLSQAVECFGDCFRVCGNVDPVSVIRDGTRDQIEAAVRNCALVGSRARCGFTLAPGCDVPADAAFEKVDWFMDACLAVS